jgi:XTP/dITP diphosphohydrolase
MELIFASQNKHKAQEIKPLIPPSYQLITLDRLNVTGEIPETGDTLEANALQKANFIFDKFRKPCFADDTGLEVEALNGEPGVYSARYAGEKKSFEDNMNKLLRELNGIKNRKAQFKTVICLAGLNGKPLYFEGVLNGSITEDKIGKNGFGYDPVFMPDGYSITLAEMSMEQKNQLSHRAIAVRKFAEYLKNVT